MGPDRNDTPTVTVLLPCLNEAQSLGACIEAAKAGIARTGLDAEVLVADNGSTDGSVEIALDHGARVVSASPRGYGSALRAGIDAARGSITVMADADATYDLERLDELVEAVLGHDVDLILGSRLDGVNGLTMPLLHRVLGTPSISFLLRRAATGIKVRDSQSGYRAFRTESIRALDLKATGMEFASEMLIRASQEGLRIGERPMGYGPRTGESKLRTFADGWRHLQLIVLLAPQLLLFWPGVFMLTLGVSLGAFSILFPAGIGFGALRWQPIFLAPILMVVGAFAALAGAILAYHSVLSGQQAVRRFSFVGDERFAGRCVTAGVAMLLPALGMEVVLFSIWLSRGASPSRMMAVAGVAQALVILGIVFIGFGLTYRIVGHQSRYRADSGHVDILRFQRDSAPLGPKAKREAADG